MPKANYKNEMTKREFFAFLKNSEQFSDNSIGSFEKALLYWEDFTKMDDFSSFDDKQAIAFRDWLKGKEKKGSKNPISLSYCYDILRYLRKFFEWLAQQPKSKINATHIGYLNLSRKESQIATRARTVDAPTFEEVLQVLESINGETEVEKRDKALIALLLTDHRCQSTAATEDFTRFAGQRGPMATLLFLPWDITMNLNTSLFATEMGFLFLALLPLWLWYGATHIRDPLRASLRSPTVQLTLLTLSYLILWFIFAERVPWYAYPALAPLAILSIEALRRSQTVSLALFRFLIILFMIGLLSNVLIRMKFAGSSGHVRYAGGTLAAEEYLQAAFPGLRTLQSGINRPDAPRVYITGSRLWYAVTDNTARAYNDSHLDTFNCLYKSLGEAGTLEAFRALDIQYVLFTRSLLTELQSDQSPTLREKVRHFTDFAGHRLRLVWGSSYYTLFEVPAASFPTPPEQSSNK